MEDIMYDQEELIPIVVELATKYAGYENTSIKYEKAQMLMEAVLYCLNEYNIYGTSDLLANNISTKEAYMLGYELVIDKMIQLRKKYNELTTYFQDYGMACLHDTVSDGVPEFLKRYDAKFCPQDTLLTLDYPVLLDYYALSGVDAVFEYITCICYEQEFLKRFERRYIIDILQHYSSQYEILIENICSIVLSNIIGHIILGKPLLDRGFSQEEYEKLQIIFDKQSEGKIENMIRNAVESIIEKFYSGNEELKQYLGQDIKNIAIRILNASKCHHLEHLFVL